MFFTGSRSGVMPHDDAFHRTRSAVATAAMRPRSSRPSARAPPRVAASNASAGLGVALDDLAADGGPAHGFDDRLRIGVGAERDVDAGLAVERERLHEDAAA